MATTAGRESPPPNYNSLNFALRIPNTRRGSQNRVRRLQVTLVVGNWIGIIAFIISAVMISVPVLSEELSSPLKTTLRILGYILMGMDAFGILFLNCVIRRTIIQELMRQEERRRRHLASRDNARNYLPPCPPGFLPIADGQPGAYIGPCSIDPKDGPLGLPDYETAIAQGPPPYSAASDEAPGVSQSESDDRPGTSTSTAQPPRQDPNNNDN